ncbi:hypothetical protein OYC64_018005 [Pagothenia borchgrevinki]|uniref:Uncharacterized protein n=1 Tax=Pagothenia borchgrevinki TaxID=8213 RepID=A0ABD2GM83_PAGBO
MNSDRGTNTSDESAGEDVMNEDRANSMVTTLPKIQWSMYLTLASMVRRRSMLVLQLQWQLSFFFSWLLS